jgi:hypothetical protein
LLSDELWTLDAAKQVDATVKVKAPIFIIFLTILSPYD